jgi:hypothetical protein
MQENVSPFHIKKCFFIIIHLTRVLAYASKMSKNIRIIRLNLQIRKKCVNFAP